MLISEIVYIFPSEIGEHPNSFRSHMKSLEEKRDENAAYGPVALQFGFTPTLFLCLEVANINCKYPSRHVSVDLDPSLSMCGLGTWIIYAIMLPKFEK